MVILPQWEVLSENPTEVMALFPLAVTLVTPLVIVMLPQYAAGPLPIPGPFDPDLGLHSGLDVDVLRTVGSGSAGFSLPSEQEVVEKP